MNKPRTISFDDGKFRKTQKETIIIGVVTRGDEEVENIASSKVKIDGDDSTEKIIEMVNNCKQNLKAIFLDGIAVAGLNVMDIERIHEKTGTPTIIISKDEPNKESMKKAIQNVSSKEEKIIKLEASGEPAKVGNSFIQCKGMKKSQVKKLLDETSGKNSLPKGLRLAHLIASGVSKNA